MRCALGWRVSVRLVQIAGLNGATVIVCAILVPGLCWALITGSRHSQVFIAVALITGFVQSVAAATVVPLVIRQQNQAYFEGGSRYRTRCGCAARTWRSSAERTSWCPWPTAPAGSAPQHAIPARTTRQH